MDISAIFLLLNLMLGWLILGSAKETPDTDFNNLCLTLLELTIFLAVFYYTLILSMTNAETNMINQTIINDAHAGLMTAIVINYSVAIYRYIKTIKAKE